MTEAEWRTSSSPVAMLRYLNADGYGREVLWYAAALLDLRPELLTRTLKVWQKVIENVLAGRSPARALDVIQTATEFEASFLAEGSAAPAARAHYSAIADAVFCTWTHAECEYDRGEALAPDVIEPTRCETADLVREIFGNPFRPVAFPPEWRTDTAVALARGMHQSSDFSAAPILADALQDAGCENEDVLGHLRDTNQIHARGCWVCAQVLEGASRRGPGVS